MKWGFREISHFGTSIKIYPQNSILIKTGKKLRQNKTYRRLIFLAQFGTAVPITLHSVKYQYIKRLVREWVTIWNPVKRESADPRLSRLLHHLWCRVQRPKSVSFPAILLCIYFLNMQLRKENHLKLINEIFAFNLSEQYYP